MFGSGSLSLVEVADICCGFDSSFVSTGVGFPLTLHCRFGDSVVESVVLVSELISTIFAGGGTAYSVKEIQDNYTIINVNELILLRNPISTLSW